MSTPNSVWTIQTSQRYRPVILVLTALAAGCSIYYIHTSLNSSSQAPGNQSTLHRSNARRRRRSLRRGANWRDDQRSSSFSLTFLEDDSANEQEYGYGSHCIRLSNGTVRRIPLTRRLLAVAEIPPRSDNDDYEYRRSRYELETVFLDCFFLRHLPPEHVVTDEERTQIVSALERDGDFTSAIIEDTLQRHSDGTLISDIEFWQNQQLRMVDSLATARTVESESRLSPDSERPETVADAESQHSWRGENDENGDTKEGQSLLNLLYRIAEEQARKDGYVHRGVTCSSCSAMPIRGIRYHCANCVDYDLCEQCEAMQIHPKTHLFYKIRIPAPNFGSPRQAQDTWYPGKPRRVTQNLPRDVVNRYSRETGFQSSEIEALWEQFRCLAATEWLEDPSKYNIAMDRHTFDKCFIPSSTKPSLPPNLIYDRLFSLFDTNGDGLIGYEEFIKGLAVLNKKTTSERLQHIFNGYDMDNDGYVDRKDFLRMFKASYVMSKELTREIIEDMEDEMNEGESRDIVLGGQPISAAFSGLIPRGETSRRGAGKTRNALGDYVVTDGMGAIDEDDSDQADLDEIVADTAEASAFPDGTKGKTSLSQTISAIWCDPWPPWHIRLTDVHAVVQKWQEPERIASIKDQNAIRRQCQGRVARDWQVRMTVRIQAIHRREKRRAFYPDEHGSLRTTKAREGKVNGDLTESAGPLEHLKHHTRSDQLTKDQISSIKDLILTFRWPVDASGLAEDIRRMFDLDFDEVEMTQVLAGYSRDIKEVNRFAQQVIQIASDRERDVAPGKDANPEVEPPPPSRRSRSSSKVRFEDGLTTDEDLDNRSVVTSMSSRSIPINERWGGFEVPDPEQDVGQEVLYQVMQEAMNDLIDPIFKVREDLAIEAEDTKAGRSICRDKINAGVDSPIFVKNCLDAFQTIIHTDGGFHPGWHVDLAETFFYYMSQINEKRMTGLTSEICPICKEAGKEQRVFFFEMCKTCGTRKRPLPYKLEESCSKYICSSCSKHYSEHPFDERFCHHCEHNTYSVTELRSKISGRLPPYYRSTTETEMKGEDNGENGTISSSQDKSGKAEIAENGNPTPPTPSTSNSSSPEGPTEPPNPPLTTPSPSSPQSNLDTQTSPSASPIPEEDIHTTLAAFNATLPTTTERVTLHTLSSLLSESDPNAQTLDPPSSPCPPPDPTLPQNRPSTIPPPPPRIPTTTPPPNPSNNPQSNKPFEPTPNILKYWAALDLLEWEDLTRGGPGRISFAEFEEVMLGERGARLGFLGGWLDYCTF